MCLVLSRPQRHEDARTFRAVPGATARAHWFRVQPDSEGLRREGILLRMRRSPTDHSYQVTTPYGVHVPVLDEREAEYVRAKGRKAVTLDKLADKMASNPDWEFW